jgi:hypothetical protein
MKLVGGTGSDTKQTLKIGDSNGQVRLESVVAGTATAKFKIAIVECPASLQSLKTTVKGTPASAMLTGLVNQITVANGGRTGLQSRLHVNLNLRRLLKSTQPPMQSALWTATEITNKEVPLVATLRETSAGKMTIGTFRPLQRLNLPTNDLCRITESHYEI